MRRITGLLALGVLLVGCEGFYLAPPSPQTWIGISGIGGCQPPEEMSLEIDGSAWALDPDACDGVVTVNTSHSVLVTLWGVATCHSYTSFEAPPGSLRLIHFLDGGSIVIEDMTGQPIVMGPALGERARSGCEASPSPLDM